MEKTTHPEVDDRSQPRIAAAATQRSQLMANVSPTNVAASRMGAEVVGSGRIVRCLAWAFNLMHLASGSGSNLFRRLAV